jgi:hypothetical protein
MLLRRGRWFINGCRNYRALRTGEEYLQFRCWGVHGDPYCRPAQKERRVTAHIVGKRRLLQAPPMSLIRRPPRCGNARPWLALAFLQVQRDWGRHH